MLREQIITHWNSLKTQLLKFKPVQENKELIIEALEFHLNQASSFTSEYSNPPLLNRKLMEQEKERLTKELERLAQKQNEVRNNLYRQQIEEDKEKVKKRITNLETALNDNTVIDNFNRQKEKNEKIVKNCKELLAKLRE